MKASEKKEDSLEMKPFQEDHLKNMIQWFHSPELMFQCFGPSVTYPLTFDKMLQFLNQHPPRIMFSGWVGDQCVALGKIIPPYNNALPRLGWIAVSPDYRGLGFGKEWMQKLIDTTLELYPNKAIELFVLEGNDTAIRCYQSVGFEILENDSLMINDALSVKRTVLKMSKEQNKRVPI